MKLKTEYPPLQIYKKPVGGSHNTSIFKDK